MSMAWDEIPGDRDGTLLRRLKNTVAMVEATSTEDFFLWKEWSDESTWSDPTWKHPRVKWEQVNPGYIETIGEVKIGKEKFPIALSLTWVRLDGQLVCFYEQTSLIQDHRLTEPWLEKKFKEAGVKWPTWDKGTRRMHADAMNFGHAIQAVNQANGKDF